jgi:hypothetical protein
MADMNAKCYISAAFQKSEGLGKGALDPSIAFLFSELLRYMLFWRDRRRKPSAAESLLLAALSKAISSAITYQQAGGLSAEAEDQEAVADNRHAQG